MIRFTLAALCLSLAVVAADAQQSAVVVVVHASNTAGAMSADDVSRIFLKRLRRWPNGSTIVPVDQDVRSAVRDAFVRRFHDRTPDALANYWQQQIFSGRETPPLVRSTEAEVIEFVAATPAAVGYVAAGTRLPATVRVLEVRSR